MWGRDIVSLQSGATHFTALWLCVGGGLREGTMLLLASVDCLGGSCLLALTPLPVTSLSLLLTVCPLCTSNCCPGAESQRGWICMSPKSVAGPLREVS